MEKNTKVLGRLTGKKKSQKKKALLRSMTFASLLGLTWVIGLFMIDSSTLFLQYVFTILVTLQGFSIFILQCVANRSIRQRFIKCLHCTSAEDHGLQSASTIDSAERAHMSSYSTSSNISSGPLLRSIRLANKAGFTQSYGVSTSLHKAETPVPLADITELFNLPTSGGLESTQTTRRPSTDSGAPSSGDITLNMDGDQGAVTESALCQTPLGMRPHQEVCLVSLPSQAPEVEVWHIKWQVFYFKSYLPQDKSLNYRAECSAEFLDFYFDG